MSKDKSPMVVTLDVDELAALVRKEIEAALATSRPEQLEYLTLSQAAKLLAVDERTVTTYVKERELPATKLGHEWRFARQELAKWMADRKFKVKKAG